MQTRIIGYADSGRQLQVNRQMARTKYLVHGGTPVDSRIRQALACGPVSQCERELSSECRFLFDQHLPAGARVYEAQLLRM